MTPTAHLAHKVRGRLRLRIEEKRRDEQYFAALREHLEGLTGVEAVQVSATTGSVLLLHSDLSYDELEPQLLGCELFELVAGPPPEVAALAPLQTGLANIDRVLGRGTAGGIDLRTIAFIATVGLAIRQMLRGQIMTPAFALMWNAMELALKFTGIGGQQEEAPGDPE